MLDNFRNTTQFKNRIFVFMRNIRWLILPLFVAVILPGCGGNSTSANSTTGSGSTTPPTVSPGTTLTLAANSSVLVPAGTTVSSPNGNIVTVNGSSNTIYTQTGATISVPSSATGTPNNLVTDQSGTGGASNGTATVTAIAGSATTNANPSDGTGASAIFWGGGHLMLDQVGNIIVSDCGSLKQVTQAGVVTTLSSGGSPDDWVGIAIDSAGNIYGSGPTNQLVSTSPATWGASIFELPASGTLTNISTNWETSTNASIGFGGLAVDSNENLYLADGTNNRIVKFTSAGVMSVFAGSGASGESDGSGNLATFNNPIDVAVDGNSNLFVSDAGAIRKITPDGMVSTVANLGGGPVAVDLTGNIYTAGFQGSALIYRIDPSGNVTSFQAPGISSFITALVADGNGNLYAGTRGQGAQILKISF